MDPLAIYYHPLFIEHETGDHVENKDRLVVATQVIADSGLDLEWIQPQAAPVEAIARVHDRDYIDMVRRLAADGGGWLDGDTAVSPKSYEAAVMAAGAGGGAAERVLSGGSNA